MGLFGNFFMELFGPGEVQLEKIGLAFLLSTLIGLEREFRLKSAGMRTHALVGLGAALMMLVSKFGFSDVLSLENVALDPSRVAAQIISGIGFIGGGLIFVRKDIVHGLTTAATIWLTAGIGMACGGGLPVLAVAATVGHFVVVFGYTGIMRKALGAASLLTVYYNYTPGREPAAKILSMCTNNGFVVKSFSMKTDEDNTNPVLTVHLQGSKPIALLAEKISRMREVVSVNSSKSPEEE
jgi:Uncharacterized membrane protein